jgi:hypothetical protein
MAAVFICLSWIEKAGVLSFEGIEFNGIRVFLFQILEKQSRVMTNPSLERIGGPD